MDDNQISHTEILKEIGILKEQSDANTSSFKTLADAVHKFQKKYDAQYEEDEPLRLFISHLYTVGRIGNFVRSAVGWTVLLIGGSLMIFDYVSGKVNF